ncbi:MAG: glucose-1-phosphate adenylyltransferase [Saprospiraceae bacterium]
MKKLIKMVSVILGGGAGTRLFPLTDKRSKPAVPIGGKYRLIDIPISNCINSGVKRMFVLTQFNSASLNQHIKNTFQFDMFSKGFVDILAAEQTRGNEKWFQGTADAVRQCMHHLRDHEHDYILILSGDQLYQMNFEQLALSHIAQGADLTIATIPVTAKDASGFGIMKVNKEGRIDSFIEKPKKSALKDWKSEVSPADKKKKKDYLASMGIYIFNKKALNKLFDEKNEADDFGKEIIPHAINSGYKVASYSYDGYWEDIGTIRSFYEANLALTDNVPAFNLFDNEQIVFTRPRLLGPTKIFGTKLVQSVLSEGCILHAKKIEGSIIGIRSRIGKRTVIKDAVVFGNDYYEKLEDITDKNRKDIPMGIGEDCLIEEAIVDKNVHIGKGVKIRGGAKLKNRETATYCVVDGIVVIKKGAVIKDGTVIGRRK